jgi:hypothetical protein
MYTRRIHDIGRNITMGISIKTYHPTMDNKVTFDGEVGNAMAAVVGLIRRQCDGPTSVVEMECEASDKRKSDRIPMSKQESMAHSAKSLHEIAAHMEYTVTQYEREIAEIKDQVQNLQRTNNELRHTGEEKYLEAQNALYKWRDRAIKAESGLRQYERQGGTINMERSWKGKYRIALAEANQRLFDAGLEPVRIRNREEKETAQAE